MEIFFSRTNFRESAGCDEQRIQKTVTQHKTFSPNVNFVQAYISAENYSFGPKLAGIIDSKLMLCIFIIIWAWAMLILIIPCDRGLFSPRDGALNINEIFPPSHQGITTLGNLRHPFIPNPHASPHGPINYFKAGGHSFLNSHQHNL